MNLYVVTKEGMYRHEICGIYDSEDLAINRAEEVCKAEHDDYHEFYVLQFDLNAAVDDGLLVDTISRKKAVLSIKRANNA